MSVTKRLAAYATCLTVGYGVPIVALAAVGNGASVDGTVYHSSSRLAARDTVATQDEFEVLRARLWALTEHGETDTCTVDGIATPCAGVIVFED